MTIQYDNLNSTISAVGSATDIPINIQPKGTGGLNVLGSGQNFQRWSEDFTDASWGKTNINVTTNATTAPNGTLTAEKIIATNTAAQHYIDQGAITPNGAVYTFSIYAKASEYTTMALRENSLGQNVLFNLATGTFTPNASLNPAIVGVGNGWYRCSITRQSTQTQVNVRIHPNQEASFTGDNVSGIFIWGAQAEIASAVGTYIPTTTTVVYGTPALTFSGVAGIGLQSNGSLYVQPAGTGALQAQATTSTAAGGNVRGANAVDWQTSRSNAAQVAGASFSVIGGGNNNNSSGFGSVICGGTGGNSGTYGVVGGGFINTATGAQSFVGGGENNTASGTSALVVGGHLNTAAGRLNFIGGGETNSGTANAAVTTQATTTVTSGSTAVTLSASNASIRVGQLITGTGIQVSSSSLNYTYVAAISGTSLTLSQAATASGSPTLSFFTPHGVVVGGGNNQATGSYSFIGGGGDAGTAANRNVASGDWSFVGGGRNNTASGGGAFVGGGGVYPAINNTYPNTASGVASVVVGGLRNSASAETSFIGGGQNNTANANQSSIVGGAYGTARAIRGNTVFPACQYPIAGTSGVSQATLLVLGVQTTDATATALRSDTSAAGTTNQIILPNNSAYFFTGEIISGVTGGGDAKGWTIEGVIKRGANAAATTLVGVTVMSTYADVGAATWTIAVTADTTNGGLRVTFTGQLATTIRTVAQIRTTEMTF
jgi:hypothetical protein